jgi:hypothetical protein
VGYLIAVGSLFVFCVGIVGLLIAAWRRWRPRYVIGLEMTVMVSGSVLLTSVGLLLLFALMADADSGN